MRRILLYFPLLLLPVLIYNMVAVTAWGASSGSTMPIMDTLNINVFSLPMISGGQWAFTIRDLLLLLGLVMLFIEILKSTSTKSATLINHALSMILLLVCLIEFLLLKSFATSAFFLLTIMALLDVLAGFMVTVVSARRDFGVGDSIAG